MGRREKRKLRQQQQHEQQQHEQLQYERTDARPTTTQNPMLVSLFDDEEAGWPASVHDPQTSDAVINEMGPVTLVQIAIQRQAAADARVGRERDQAENQRKLRRRELDSGYSFKDSGDDATGMKNKKKNTLQEVGATCDQCHPGASRLLNKTKKLARA